MKKSLVALAVLAATGAYAQSSVTLYGIVEATTDFGYNRNIDTRTTVTDTNFFNFVFPSTTTATTSRQKNNFRIQDGSDQGTGSSRVGFRGTEDLGGGLKANFVLEMGLRVDDGCTTLGGVVGPFGTAATAANGVNCNNGGNSGNSGGSTFGRNAWGGLSGGFGEVRLGRQVLGSFGVQSSSGASGSSNGLYDATTATLLPMGGIRFSNAARYLSPNFGGFRGSVMVSAPETPSFTSSTAAGPVFSGASRRTGVDLALEYANGPAYVGFGYNKRDAANVTSVVTPPNPNIVSVSPGTVNGYTLGGSYDLGVVKPFINYTRQTTAISGSTVDNVGFFNASNASNANSRALSVGVRAPVGAFTAIAGYGRVNTTTNSSTAATIGLPNLFTTFTNATAQQRVDAFQLGAQYALSKRTLVEVNYGYNRVGTNSNSVVTTNGVVPANGCVPAPAGCGGNRATSTASNERISAMNVGLKHSF